MSRVDSAYKSINSLNVLLPALRDTAAEHSQLNAAVENVKDIIRVPETVATIDGLIKNRRFLVAHTYLAGDILRKDRGFN